MNPQSAVAEIIITPDTVQQVLTRKHLTAVFSQSPQQLYFLFRQRYVRAADSDQIFVQIDHKIADAVQILLLGFARWTRRRIARTRAMTSPAEKGFRI